MVGGSWSSFFAPGGSSGCAGRARAVRMAYSEPPRAADHEGRVDSDWPGHMQPLCRMLTEPIGLFGPIEGHFGLCERRPRLVVGVTFLTLVRRDRNGCNLDV